MFNSGVAKFEHVCSGNWSLQKVDTPLLKQLQDCNTPHHTVYSCHKKESIKMITQLLGEVEIPIREPLKHNKCIICKIGDLVTIARFDIRGLPKIIKPINLDTFILLK